MCIRDRSHHIGSIISVQQQYADLKRGIKTSVSLGSVIEDCFLINESKIAKSYVKIVRNWNNDQKIVVEKNGFIQVFSNILINSIESIEAKMSKDNKYKRGIIEISSKIENEFLVIELKDDALGFNKKVGENLFNFGFSTKERSSGFGLHNCQNFMNTQGGKFEITSEGEGEGALVRVFIPLNSRE
jgi:nitrogen fixation/metabolism regulation signal transduction histidine kinase